MGYFSRSSGFCDGISAHGLGADPHDRVLYRQRHRIENVFGKLKDWRRISIIRGKNGGWGDFAGVVTLVSSEPMRGGAPFPKRSAVRPIMSSIDACKVAHGILCPTPRLAGWKSPMQTRARILFDHQKRKRLGAAKTILG